MGKHVCKDLEKLLRWKIQTSKDKVEKTVPEQHIQWEIFQHYDDMNIKKYIMLKKGPDLPDAEFVELLRMARHSALTTSSHPKIVDNLIDTYEQDSKAEGENLELLGPGDNSVLETAET